MANKVCLDAGWGGSQIGASGNGLKCKDITLNVTLKIGEILKEAGVEVVYTRTSDVNVSLSSRVKLANSNSVDLYVVVHANAYKKSSAKGYETYYYKSKDKVFADKVHASIISDSSLYQSNRGVKKNNYYVLKNTSMPACMPVLGFITNTADANIIKNKMDVFAKKIAEAICSHLNVEPKPDPPIPPDPPPPPPPPPTIGSVTVSNTTPIGEYIVRYSATAGSGALKHRIKLNNGDYATINPKNENGVFVFEGVNLKEGSNNGQVEVKDSHGFAVSPVFPIVIPSDLLISTPQRVDQHQGVGFSITYNVTGTNSNCTHEFSDDGGKTYSNIAPSKSGTSYTFKRSYSSMGTRQCKIRVKNNAGTIRETDVFIVNIREPLKSLSVITGFDDYISIKSNTLNVGYVSNRTINSSKLSINNGNSFEYNCSFTSDYIILPINNLVVGVYTCKLKSTDGWGFECISNTFVVKITNNLVSDAFEIIEVVGDKKLVANEFIRVAIKLKTKKTLGSGCELQPRVKYSGDYTLKNIQFEKGTVPSDWSKSILDTEVKVDEAKQNADLAKELAETAKKEIGDLNTTVGDLENALNGAFKDEIIDATELKIIEENLRQLDKEKMDLDAQFNQLYNNINLI